jgi:hypothetical protein
VTLLFSSERHFAPERSHESLTNNLYHRRQAVRRDSCRAEYPLLRSITREVITQLPSHSTAHRAYSKNRSRFPGFFLARFSPETKVFNCGLDWLTYLSPPLAAYLCPYNLASGILGQESVMLWLLVMGVNVQRWKEQASAAGERRS